MGRVWRPKLGCRFRQTVVVGTLILITLLGYGISSSDARRMQIFCDAVIAWKTNPEFRTVGREYCELSSVAMRTQPFGISATRMVMAIRSIPHMPESIKANATSLDHYVHFAHGPLSAYVYLSAEQGVNNVTGMLETLGQHDKPLSDDDIRNFLESFKIDPPPVTDAGAIASVRKLIADVNPATPFAIRKPVPSLLEPQIHTLMDRNKFPGILEDLSVKQEDVLLSQLDDEVKATDYELWRTKQASDFLNGIWASYGEIYQSKLIGPMLKIRTVCRPAAPILIAVTLVIWLRKRLRHTENVVSSGLPNSSES